MSSNLSGSELLEIQKEMKIICDNFFQELKKAELITDSSIKEFDAKKYLTWLNRDDSLIANGKIEMVSHMDSIVSEKFPAEDFIKFLIVLSIYQFTIKLEQLKDVFLDCLIKEKLKLKSDDPTLGDIIWAINNILYPLDQISDGKKEDAKKIRKSYQDLFFIEFRNAVIHKTYVVGSERITYLNKEREEKRVSLKELSTMIEKFDFLRQYIYEYKLNLEKSQE